MNPPNSKPPFSKRELTAIIDGDRYFLSPPLREIRNKIRPEPKREPLPERKHYEPPSKGRYRNPGEAVYLPRSKHQHRGMRIVLATRPPKPPERESAPRYRKRGKTGIDQPLSKARSLAQLARSDIAEHESGANIEEFTGNSDRTTSIAATAMIERDLERLILFRLGIENGKLRDMLFERDGALSTFYGNIRFGRALGFYDKSFRHYGSD